VECSWDSAAVGTATCLPHPSRTLPQRLLLYASCVARERANRFWNANTGASVAVRRSTCQCHRTFRCLCCVGGSSSGPPRSASSLVYINGRQATRLTRLQRPNGIPLISYCDRNECLAIGGHPFLANLNFLSAT
jgi:hypothetical protein